MRSGSWSDGEPLRTKGRDRSSSEPGVEGTASRGMPQAKRQRGDSAGLPGHLNPVSQHRDPVCLRSLRFFVPPRRHRENWRTDIFPTDPSCETLEGRMCAALGRQRHRRSGDSSGRCRGNLLAETMRSARGVAVSGMGVHPVRTPREGRRGRSRLRRGRPAPSVSLPVREN